MRIGYRGLMAVTAIVLTMFAVSNRETVSLGFWPLPFVLDLPLYLLVLVPLLTGFVIGEFAAWVAGRRRRREFRRRGRHIEALERELAATRSQPSDRPATRLPAPG